MYLSRPVRAIIDDPHRGETVTLILRLPDGWTDADIDRVTTAVETAGGDVVKRLSTGGLKVAADHEDVAAITAIDGLDAVETDDTLRMALDGAGEDVEYPSETR
ncbi:hypothetical protein ACFQH3_07880 [Haladaptatus sp. GCM10025707]|uniref:hypothetical protein n=1 Tax=unclassified Haladaptatus TaxID=2622732 RepID=UPI0023E872E1|nr:MULTISPECIES: hypothetical protein [unclassified Haladaptatus]